jgi:predicted nucleic acid-binding Zn ribbon protein
VRIDEKVGRVVFKKKIKNMVFETRPQDIFQLLLILKRFNNPLPGEIIAYIIKLMPVHICICEICGKNELFENAFSPTLCSEECWNVEREKKRRKFMEAMKLFGSLAPVISFDFFEPDE